MNNESLRRHVAVTTVGNLLNPLSLIIVAPFLANGLGVVGRGEVAAATAPLVLAIAVSTLGIPEAATYFAASRGRLSRSIRMKLLLALVALGLASTGIIWVTAPLLSGNSSDITDLIRLGGLAVAPALVLALVRALAAARALWHLIAFEKAIAGGVRLLVICTIFWSIGLDPLNATIGMSISYFIGLLAYARPWRAIDRTPNAAPTTREFLSYGSALWLGSLSGIVLGRVDQMLITPLAGAAALGIYVVAVNLSEVVLVVNSALRDVIFPAESKRADTLRLTQAARVSTILTATLSIFVCALSPIIIPILFGVEFSAAIPIVVIVSLGLVLGNPGSIAGAGLSARNRPGIRGIAMGIACAVNIALLITLTPEYGALGAAIAASAGSAIAGLAAILSMRWLFGVPVLDFYGIRKDDFNVLLRLARSAFRRRNTDK